MLSGILSKESCAGCRFCCSFRRASLWEVPVFTKENTEAIRKNPKLDETVLIPFSENADYARYDLSSHYQTDDSEEEAKCPYLSETGCVLSKEEKPWDCSIWPLRVMRKEDGELVIALTPTCPAINKLEFETVRQYVNENLREELLDYALKHPLLVKEYRVDFPIIDPQ